MHTSGGPDTALQLIPTAAASRERRTDGMEACARGSHEESRTPGPQLTGPHRPLRGAEPVRRGHASLLPPSAERDADAAAGAVQGDPGAQPRRGHQLPVGLLAGIEVEHFVLQSARSTTVSEAVGRSAVYLTCVSSAIVAFGIFAAATHDLAPVVCTVLPALIILGISPSSGWWRPA
jgi:hypothetical protein